MLAAADHKTRRDGGRRFQIDSPSLSNLVMVVIREQINHEAHKVNKQAGSVVFQNLGSPARMYSWSGGSGLWLGETNPWLALSTGGTLVRDYRAVDEGEGGARSVLTPPSPSTLLLAVSWPAARYGDPCNALECAPAPSAAVAGGHSPPTYSPTARRPQPDCTRDTRALWS